MNGINLLDSANYSVSLLSSKFLTTHNSSQIVLKPLIIITSATSLSQKRLIFKIMQNCTTVPELRCTHEEADTRILLHSK
ncbi:hypothetical protein HOLleu_37136 [Holothuria leucospilota]|uniref:Uncharacterized protein n=1 Tax=Holothuria leucospilota TaxID=206669 RepID=A0A9Q0YGX1_HOLLE|nr:hypothetical protein HOLleu_37136 [Holothuria leucospilota]